MTFVEDPDCVESAGVPDERNELRDRAQQRPAVIPDGEVPGDVTGERGRAS
jgi:hypothetical protein